MAGTLNSTNSKLDTAINQWQDVSKRLVADAVLLQGTGNETYRITCEDQRFVLRLNGETEHLGVNRRLEGEILEMIKAQNLGADCLFWSDTFCVFEFLESNGETNAQDIAALFSRLHQFSEPTWFQHQPRWTPLHTIEDYLQVLPAAVESAKPLVESLQQLNWSNCHYGLCHIDPNPGSILNTPVGNRLIDWEYARYGPTIYDIAVLFRTTEIDQQTFLENYALPVDTVLVEQAALSYDLIEVLWLAITENWPLPQIEERIEALFLF